MNTIAVEIGGHNIGICVYASHESFVRAGRRLFGKSVKHSTRGLAFHHKENRASHVLLFHCDDLRKYALHELSHVADFMLDEWKRRKEFVNIDKSEFRAYMLCDLAEIFDRWEKAGFSSEINLDDLFFNGDGAWKKYLKKDA